MSEILKTILGTIKGADNEGSSKRATAAYFTVISVTVLTFTYCYGLYRSYMAPSPTTIHTTIIEIYLYVLGFILLSLLAALGLTNIDKWIDKIPFMRGKSEEPKQKTDA